MWKFTEKLYLCTVICSVGSLSSCVFADEYMKRWKYLKVENLKGRAKNDWQCWSACSTMEIYAFITNILKPFTMARVKQQHEGCSERRWETTEEKTKDEASWVGWWCPGGRRWGKHMIKKFKLRVHKPVCSMSSLSSSGLCLYYLCDFMWELIFWTASFTAMHQHYSFINACWRVPVEFLKMN